MGLGLYHSHKCLDRRIEFLGEGVASERVDMKAGLHIIERDLTHLIIHKHPQPSGASD